MHRAPRLPTGDETDLATSGDLRSELLHTLDFSIAANRVELHTEYRLEDASARAKWRTSRRAGSRFACGTLLTEATLLPA